MVKNNCLPLLACLLQKNFRLLHHVDREIVTDVSEERKSFIFRVKLSKTCTVWRWRWKLCVLPKRRLYQSTLHCRKFAYSSTVPENLHCFHNQEVRYNCNYKYFMLQWVCWISKVSNFDVLVFLLRISRYLWLMFTLTICCNWLAKWRSFCAISLWSLKTDNNKVRHASWLSKLSTCIMRVI